MDWEEGRLAFIIQKTVGQSKWSPALTQGTGRTGEAGAHRAQASALVSLGSSCLCSRNGNLHLLFLDVFFSWEVTNRLPSSVTPFSLL